MKNIKNYLKLAGLIIVTVLLTLFFADRYKISGESELYLFANKITESELEEFLVENPDAIVYLSKKNNSKYENFELELKFNIEKYNLKEKFVFIDNENITKELYEYLNLKYNSTLVKCKGPNILVILDSKLSSQYCVTLNTDADDFIDYKVFE